MATRAAECSAYEEDGVNKYTLVLFVPYTLFNRRSTHTGYHGCR